jgi:hypothetical protein
MRALSYHHDSIHQTSYAHCPTGHANINRPYIIPSLIYPYFKRMYLPKNPQTMSRVTSSASSYTFSSDSSLLYLPPSEKTPQADLNREIIVGWKLIDVDGAMYFPIPTFFEHR